MSKVRNPMLAMAKNSIQICGLRNQRSGRRLITAPAKFMRPRSRGIPLSLLFGIGRSLLLALRATEFGRHRLEFDRLLQHRVIAMPLHEVGAAHKGSVFAGASVVM